MSENKFMGVPRDKIPWYPEIDYEKCNYCMDCVKVCPHNVFECRESEEKKLVVANTENCVVFCKACAKVCGPDALSFPDNKQILNLIKKLQKEVKE